MQPDRFIRVAVCLFLLVGVRSPAAAGDTPQGSTDSPAFRDFTQRVQRYLKLRKGLPEQRTTKHREEIVDRRHTLAQAIRESRADAKQGDIFTPEISEHFLRLIRATLRGSNASDVRKTIRQGEPVAGVHLIVNGAYPEDLPMTTVPPTLLRHLPQLPERLAYRIVGHDFVLQDTEARLVIDFIPGALP